MGVLVAKEGRMKGLDGEGKLSGKQESNNSEGWLEREG